MNFRVWLIHFQLKLKVHLQSPWSLHGWLYWTQWDFLGMKRFKMMDRVWMRFYIIPILINISWCINTSRCYMPACILLSKWHMWQVQWRCLEQSAGIHNKSQSINHLRRPSDTKHTLITYWFCTAKSHSVRLCTNTKHVAMMAFFSKQLFSFKLSARARIQILKETQWTGHGMLVTVKQFN